MNACAVQKLLDEFAAGGCDLSVDQQHTLAVAMVKNGIGSMDALSQGNTLDISSLTGTDAASKIFLRRTVAKIASNVPNTSSHTATSAILNSERSVGFQTVSAEHVLSCIRLASNMRVDRPDLKPMQMIESLHKTRTSENSRILFVQLARLEAICGNMVSIREAATAVRCWSRFGTTMGIVAKDHELPPTVTGLVAWSRIFAVKNTYTNYMSKLALACEIAGVSRKAFSHPSVARAKRTIGTLQSAPKPKRGIRLDLLERLVTLAEVDGDRLSALLYIVSYAFLLRVPSEGLPMVVGGATDMSTSIGLAPQSALIAFDDKIVLRLRKRKNKQNGAIMTRRCWCQTSVPTCPVHAAGAIIRCMRRGSKLFEGSSPAGMLKLLRARLNRLDVPFHESYETKDFRRGHARDLARKPNTTLKEIMQMGQWKSSALLKYLDLDEIETECVVEAHIAESESDGEKLY